MHKQMHSLAKCAALISLLAFAGCSTTAQQTPSRPNDLSVLADGGELQEQLSSAPGVSVQWQDLQLKGKTLQLINPNREEIYKFSGDNIALARLYEKDVITSAPLLYWKIENDSLILSTYPESKFFESLKAISISGDILKTQRASGKEAFYRISE